MAVAAISATLVAAYALSMNGPETNVKKQSQADETASAATTSMPPSTTDEPQPITEAPPTTEAPPATTAGARGAVGKEIIRLQLNVGDCVTLSGTGDNTAIGKTTCGSTGSNYKIIDKAPPNGQCPTDADHTWGTDQSALCLDIDWVIGGCMELTPNDPKRIDCTTRGTPNGVKVVEVKQHTTNVNTCSTSNRGIVYQQRQFVVCVARL
jgi:hypothetical protein